VLQPGEEMHIDVPVEIPLPPRVVPWRFDGGPVQPGDILIRDHVGSTVLCWIAPGDFAALRGDKRWPPATSQDLARAVYTPMVIRKDHGRIIFVEMAPAR
jgi:hypothetical protein